MLFFHVYPFDKFEFNSFFIIFQANDRYFLDSNDKIRFFFETDAFDGNGKLQLSKHACLNKMGHALHWVDPNFKKVRTRLYSFIFLEIDLRNL